MKEKISLAMARRIALAAQGFADPRPGRTPDRRHLARVLARTGLLQIDSVSAVVRAHYMPLYSRLGPYPLALLDNAAVTRKRKVFEYWAHEASFLPVETYPLMRWRMERAERGEEMYNGLAKWGRERAAYIEDIYREVVERGPIAASALRDQKGGQKGSGGWWGWSDAKHAFEWLFWAGRITTASRRGFERLYDLPQRVLPPAILSLPVPSPEDAHRELLRISARAHGVATAGDLRDYFRLSPADIKGRIEELVEAGDLLPVRVEGWSKPAYLHKDARFPRKIKARALLAPFDPVVFERARTERLFDFRYRIEIYTPAEKRQYGYYVLPFLLGEGIVARIDLRADRPAGVLRVHAAYAEPGAPPQTAAELFEELQLMQGWLGLERIEVTPAGDLGSALADVAVS
ncbi:MULTISPECIES: winged helix-turn-helix domain-containing protein [unclassified Mesorhizobium]|uniref:winged helix-turn-helix domain-containing protein n=1 Tax=unclassified Mesorhizobium TaxID=325217 RepID=UPI000FE57E30|nr:MULTISPECIES: winged helix-turn-helix domain-containing protein [unclassified Mesorhizobium]RWI27987.1 MAG: winged helix-turn-helix domain-containing protein [Mesorhizobium sp.]RWK52107.1 MAG: winged helix-turn-helix domain-containing protein [Mesorhizobium sp.]RWK96760.1 MAG: winged helix-turn-helix domain-containing protein [Mesorhizobium sp.]RWL12230.1 MAG: winged helix-turn-helix domain-containing protein [Mesorhizobium sp.]TIP59857.1 MAG: winged helix-turn-helix domain-containing prote